MNDRYKKRVALLIRIMPSVYEIEEFAVHGGTAINMFHKDMPRYSVDIDLTYIPLKDREKSLNEINVRLTKLKQQIEKTVPGIKITHKPNVWKLFCVKDGDSVKMLSRQHPRDLFDCKYMDVESFDVVKNGLMFCLISSDKPIIESLQPNLVNQEDTLKNQFEGMSDIPFGYTDFDDARKDLIERVNGILTDDDKEFLISFEQGTPK
jgi:hypothetical protein